MKFFLLTFVPLALAGYANPPNVAPALAAYGTSYGGNQYNVAPGYSSGPSYSPYGVNGVYGGANSYNLGYQPHPFMIYANQQNYGGYGGNNYLTGYPTNSYNTGNTYSVGPSYTPAYTQGPNYNTGATIVPSIGPIGITPIPVGPITGSTYTGPTSFGTGVTPAGVLPSAFSTDPWAAISAQPILRGVKQVHKTSAEKEATLVEETKKKKMAKA